MLSGSYPQEHFNRHLLTPFWLGLGFLCPFNVRLEEISETGVFTQYENQIVLPHLNQICSLIFWQAPLLPCTWGCHGITQIGSRLTYYMYSTTRVCVGICGMLTNEWREVSLCMRAWRALTVCKQSQFTVLTSLWATYGTESDPHRCRHASEEVISQPFKSQTTLLPIVTIF